MNHLTEIACLFNSYIICSWSLETPYESEKSSFLLDLPEDVCEPVWFSGESKGPKVQSQTGPDFICILSEVSASLPLYHCI